MTVIIEDRFRGQADAVYAALVDAHRDLTEVQSAALNIRLVLLLANATGDPELVEEAVAEARRLTLASVPGR